MYVRVVIVALALLLAPPSHALGEPDVEDRWRLEASHPTSAK